MNTKFLLETKEIGMGPAPEMRHIMCRDNPAMRLCGTPRDPSKPVTYAQTECVVCADLWNQGHR